MSLNHTEEDPKTVLVVPTNTDTNTDTSTNKLDDNMSVPDAVARVDEVTENVAPLPLPLSTPLSTPLPDQQESQTPAEEAEGASAHQSKEPAAEEEEREGSAQSKEPAAADTDADGDDNDNDRSVDSGSSTREPSVNDVSVVISKPKTTAELVAARALKRMARRTALHEKAESHRQAAELLQSQNNYKAACTHYQEATKLWPSNVEYLISLAGVYRKLEWYEEAAYSATRALTLDPKNSEARYVRGIARLEQRLLAPAKVDFEIVLAHDPEHLRASAALNEANKFLEASTHLGAHSLSPNPVEEIVKDVDFGFPRWDEDALELASMSDSSDAQHVGNGIQCRFYNHEGCARGSTCVFSHAPDEKSVRDDLGKNVCTYFLLDMCKFGATKCIYSHSRAALPKSGWWTSEEKIAKVKAVMELAEKNAREQRAMEKERWREYVRARKAAAGGGKSQQPKAQQKAGGTNAAADQHPKDTQAEGGSGAASKGKDTATKATGGEKSKRKPHGPNGTGRRNRTHGTGHGHGRPAKASTEESKPVETPAADGEAQAGPVASEAKVVADEPASATTTTVPPAQEQQQEQQQQQEEVKVAGGESDKLPEEKTPAGAEKSGELEKAPAAVAAPEKSTEKKHAKKNASSSSGPGFVDYELNRLPPGGKPIVHQTDDPVTLPY